MLTRRKRLFFKVICLGGIPLCLVLLIELVSLGAYHALFINNATWPRYYHLIANPELGWTIHPDVEQRVAANAQGYDITYKTTKGPFRKDLQNLFDPAEADIITIGDSHVFGFGLQAEETLAWQLHTRLSDEKENVKVLNAGVPGYGPGQYYLRLKSLGQLENCRLVVVYINPINDIGNLSREIDYRHPKPHARLENGKLSFQPPPKYVPTLAMRTAPEYSRIDRMVGSPERPGIPLAGRLADWSATARLFRDLVNDKICQRWSRMNSGAPYVKNETPEQFMERQRQSLRRESERYFRAYWPAIREFDQELHLAGKTLELLFEEMQAHVNAMGAELLVVVSEEYYRRQSFSVELTDIWMQEYPPFSFDWAQARKCVVEALERANVGYIVMQYPEESLENCFVPYDGHTSAKGFEVVVNQIEARVAGSAD